MFEQVLGNLRTATETSMRMQQEAFKKWVALWPGMPAPANGAGEKMMRFQKEWAEFITGLVRKQREMLEAQFSAGMKTIEEAFKLGEVKAPEELRAKTVELWQKSFDCMRQLCEAQVRDFQEAMVKWTELMIRGAT